MSKKKAMFFKVASGGGDTDADLFITNAGITDPTIQDAITNLVLGLKANNTWNSYYAIYPFASDGISQTREFQHKWNLKDTTNYNITWGGTVNHDADGVMSDGSTGYGNTNFLYSNIGATAIDFSFGFYSQTNTSTNGGVEMGVNNFGNGAFLNLMQSLETEFFMQNQKINVSYGTDTLGYYVANKASATDMSLNKNGTSIGVNTVSNSPSTYSQNINILAWNNNNSAGNYSLHKSSFITIGQGFTTQQVSDDYDTINDFQIALTRNV